MQRVEGAGGQVNKKGCRVNFCAPMVGARGQVGKKYLTSKKGPLSQFWSPYLVGAQGYRPTGPPLNTTALEQVLLVHHKLL